MPKRPSHLNPTRTIGENDQEKRKKIHHAPSWDVASKVSSLPSIPFLHIPSPTCAVFSNATDPRIIANAIVDVVTSLSSVGNYNGQFASATIYSMTNMKISIQMYKHSSNTSAPLGEHHSSVENDTCDTIQYENDTSSGIMVEFNRLKGDIIEYHRTIQTITSNVRRMEGCDKGQEKTKVAPKPCTPLTSANRPLLKRPKLERTYARRVSLADENIHDNENSRSNSIFAGAMQNIDTLIHKDRLDAVELGMQSLSLLTSSSSSTSSADDVVILASKAILMDSNDSWQGVRNFIFGIIMDDTEDDGLHEDEEGYGSYSISIAGSDCRLRLALSILANTLSTASKHKNDFVPQMDENELKRLLSTMTKYMKRMTISDSCHAQAQQLQIAYQAARCISSLIQMTPGMKTAALDLGIVKLAQDGVDIGSCHHPMVGRLSKDILSSLSGVPTINSGL